MSKKVNNMIDSVLIEVLKSSLQEEDKENPQDKKEPPKKTSGSPDILTRGAFGSGGRAKSFVVSARARAENEPEELLRELGITSAPSGTDLSQVLSILNSAIHSNPVMGRAYSGASIRSSTASGESKPRDVIGIVTADIDRKNGVRFLAHTLKAALNAGFLNLERSVQFGIGQEYPIIIYSS